VESILAQADVQLELIVVDDGSTDGSGAMLDLLAKQDSRLRVIHQQNTGLTKALARGCAEARGEFIARQDADDVSLPGRLAQQAHMLRSDATLSMVSCWAQAIGPGDERLWEIRRTSDPTEATDGLLNRRQGPPCHGTVMFRRSAYQAAGGYRWQFWFGQDSDLWLRLGDVGRLGYVPGSYYHFRIDENSISSRHRTVQNQFGELGHRCRACRLRGEPETALLGEAEWLRAVVINGRRGQGRRGAGAYLIGRWLLRAGDPAAIRYLRRATTLEPWNVKAWLSLLQARRLRQESKTPSG
jgi:glycosyltransferase involved in cell wall biosynthesis